MFFKKVRARRAPSSSCSSADPSSPHFGGRSPLSRRLLQQTPDLHALAYVQGTRFEARFDAPHLIELDGDSFGHITRVRVSVRPGTLHVRVAAETNSVEKGTAARQRPSRL